MRRPSALASVAALLMALSGAPAPAQGAAAQSADAAPPDLAAARSAAISRFLEPYAAASAACRAAIEQAATLSSAGKWKSAFQAMDAFDKDNADPFALAMKTSLVLRGAVRTDMDRSFGLADLEEGQDLETLRNSQGDYAPIPLDPPALAQVQADKGVEAPGILSKELGDYYLDVAGRFSGKWSIGDDQTREDRRGICEGLRRRSLRPREPREPGRDPGPAEPRRRVRSDIQGGDRARLEGRGRQVPICLDPHVPRARRRRRWRRSTRRSTTTGRTSRVSTR